MYILGINAYHGDSSACIYSDSELIAGTEEERIVRIKHWAGLPIEAIKFCLDEAGISINEVDFIAVSRDPKAKFGKKALYALKNITSIGRFVNSRAGNSFKINDLKIDIAKGLNCPPESITAKIHFVEHHRSHLASAFFVSPFEESAVLSVDGFGDFSSTMRGKGSENQISVIDSVDFPHSVGMFYTAFTQFLGFPNFGDEYKVMGLAPYGKPTEYQKLQNVIKLKNNGLFELNKHYFRHFEEGVAMNWTNGSPTVEAIFSDRLADEFGKPRDTKAELTQHHINLATSVQRMCEDVIFHLATGLHKITGSDNLCLAGGVAQNSVANGKLLKNTPFKKLYIPPAGHDAGTSTGAALYVQHSILEMKRQPSVNMAYTGAKFDDNFVEDFLKSRKIDYIQLSDESLFDTVSDAIIAGGVIGWFQGRAEFGPRALGNRSILADPRREDAKELLNSKIKRRESFRPFAPSILKEHIEDYFETDDFDVPYMEKVFVIKPEKRHLIPAVTHVDGTGRLQSVSLKDNKRYYDLIHKFYTKTGIPVLLNTSFNENEPIVNTPEHALECYLRTQMDMLVLGNFVIQRTDRLL